MTQDTNPVPENAQGKPAAPICRFCTWPRVIRNGAFFCMTCDIGDALYPIFLEAKSEESE